MLLFSFIFHVCPCLFCVWQRHWDLVPAFSSCLRPLAMQCSCVCPVILTGGRLSSSTFPADLRLYTLKINIAGVWNILWSSLTVIFLNLYPTTLCIPSLLCHRWHPNSSPQYLLWNIWNVLAHCVVDGNLLTSRVSLVMPGGIVIHWDWDVVMGSQVNWKHASEEVQLLSHPQSLRPGTNDKTKTVVVAVFVCCWFWCYTWVETGCFHVCFHVWCPI